MWGAPLRGAHTTKLLTRYGIGLRMKMQSGSVMSTSMPSLRIACTDCHLYADMRINIVLPYRDVFDEKSAHATSSRTTPETPRRTRS